MVKQTPISAATPGRALHPKVEIIDTFAAFKALRPGWERLMQRDPQAHVFLSWEWLAEAFRANPNRWSVITVRAHSDSDDFTCIVPLKYRLHWSRSQKAFHSEIEAGGRLLWSEYTGFLCDPAQEEPGLQSAAAALAALPWARLSMRYVPQQRRAEIFTAAFPEKHFRVSWKDYRINKGETDNLICPQAVLPEDFESYLQNAISANARQKYRRFLRKMEANGYRFTHADSASFARDLDILLRLWSEKWRPRKGAATARKVAENYRQVLMAAQATNTLYLPMLWQGERPLAALGHVMDPDGGRVHFILAGRDTSVRDASLGAALHFHAIRTAIDRGYEVYDFCHGNEKYKYSFGVEEKKVSYFSIRRRDTSLAQNFDAISSGEALRRALRYLDEGRLDKARAGLQQIANLLS